MKELRTYVYVVSNCITENTNWELMVRIDVIFIFQFYFSITVDIQYYFIFVSGVQHTGSIVI